MTDGERRPLRLLILGGSGFVGSHVCRLAISRGYDVVVVTRRGPGPLNAAHGDPILKADWTQRGDARDPEFLRSVMAGPSAGGRGPFDAVVHCVGVLFDGASGLGSLNRIVSGIGSLPDASATYDDITKKTVDALADAAGEHCAPGTPFVFMSAAEAGWPDMPGGTFVERWIAPSFLQRYLSAKRGAEAVVNTMVAGRQGGEQQQQQQADGSGAGSRVSRRASASGSASQHLRGVTIRPSFVWRWSKLDILVPAFIYSILNAVGVPFVDRPVRVDDVAEAVLEAVQLEATVWGTQHYADIDRLAAAGRRRTGAAE